MTSNLDEDILGLMGEEEEGDAPVASGKRKRTKVSSLADSTDDDDDDDDDEDDEEEEGGGAAAKQLESLRAGVEQMRVKLRAATALAVLATAKIGVGLSPGAMPVA